MTDPSSNHAQRSLQLTSHGIPTEGSSAPSSASVNSPLSPGSNLPHLGPTSRPQSVVGPAQYPHFPHPGAGSKHAGYPQPYYAPGIGPSQQPSLPGYHEISQGPNAYSDPTALPINAQIPGQQAQKRAYRQRRKDPSCDACRERKVKCDATDSSSCTECKSRSVTCQFTKETNRRMTSIKQNQDLSKELATAQAEISRLRSMINSEKPTVSSRHHLAYSHLPIPSPHYLPNHHLSHLPVSEDATLPPSSEDQSTYERPHKRRRMADIQDFSKIGLNMAKFGRGIFKTPYPRQPVTPPVAPPTPLPGLPPKDVADVLLRQYRYTIHPMLPIIHWRAFQEQYERVYRDGSLHNAPSIWSSLLFAIFACGTLHRSWSDGQRYQEVSISLIDLWTEDFTLDHARAALLNCMFLVESNRKSAGWNWMGIAVRVSFDIGLNCEAGTWDPVEAEMRRRVWWSIYACDCLLSLEIGRPAMIKEDDCNVRLPSPVADEFIREDNRWMSPSPEMETSALLPTIRVIGPISRLLQILKSPQISPDSLRAYDSHFDQVMSAFPGHLQVRSTDYVDPVDIIHIFYLQNARLIIHRHNLTPLCDQQVRSAAIDDCALAAKDTARLLQRTMQDPPSSSMSSISDRKDPWEKRMVSAASAFVCTHIWRCTLFLLFRLDFDSALICSRASRVLDDSRAINTACGRYLDFFLSQLLVKSRKGVDFDLDEELIAYVSGDLQGNFESSWIWQESKADLHLGRPFQTTDECAPNRRSLDISPTEMNGHNDDGEWAGWDKIVKLVEGLSFEKSQTKEPPRPILHDVRTPAIHLPPLAASPSPSATTPRERLSIKDLL